MKVQVTTESGSQIVSALLYAFPKKGNAPADYNLTVNGEAAKTAQTGGGKYPRYVYVMIGGVSHYLPKNIIPVSGSNITTVKEEAKAKPAEEPKPAVKAEPEAAEPAEAKMDETNEVLKHILKAVEQPAAKATRKRVPKAEQQQAAA